MRIKTRLEREGELLTWRLHLRSRGLDPDMIGEHEVEPIRCGHCGEAIPWRTIKSRV
jgi:hypothetical protein